MDSGDLVFEMDKSIPNHAVVTPTSRRTSVGATALPSLMVDSTMQRSLSSRSHHYQPPFLSTPQSVSSTWSDFPHSQASSAPISFAGSPMSPYPSERYGSSAGQAAHFGPAMIYNEPSIHQQWNPQAMQEQLQDLIESASTYDLQTFSSIEIALGNGTADAFSPAGLLPSSSALLLQGVRSAMDTITQAHQSTGQGVSHSFDSFRSMSSTEDMVLHGIRVLEGLLRGEKKHAAVDKVCFAYLASAMASLLKNRIPEDVRNKLYKDTQSLFDSSGDVILSDTFRDATAYFLAAFENEYRTNMGLDHQDLFQCTCGGAPTMQCTALGGLLLFPSIDLSDLITLLDSGQGTVSPRFIELHLLFSACRPLCPRGDANTQDGMSPETFFHYYLPAVQRACEPHYCACSSRERHLAWSLEAVSEWFRHERAVGNETAQLSRAPSSSGVQPSLYAFSAGLGAPETSSMSRDSSSQGSTGTSGSGRGPGKQPRPDFCKLCEVYSKCDTQRDRQRSISRHLNSKMHKDNERKETERKAAAMQLQQMQIKLQAQQQQQQQHMALVQMQQQQAATGVLFGDDIFMMDTAAVLQKGFEEDSGDESQPETRYECAFVNGEGLRCGRTYNRKDNLRQHEEKKNHGKWRPRGL